MSRAARSQVGRWLEEQRSTSGPNRRVPERDREPEILQPDVREPYMPLQQPIGLSQQDKLFWLGIALVVGALAWGAWSIFH